jgi:hypothetical protein
MLLASQALAPSNGIVYRLVPPGFSFGVLDQKNN